MGNYIIFLIDYFRIKKLGGFLCTLTIPVLLTAGVVALTGAGGYVAACAWIGDAGVNVLGVLLGFLITTTAMIATSDNENMRAAKKYEIGVSSFGKKKNLYDELVVEAVWATTWAVISILAYVAMGIWRMGLCGKPWMWLCVEVFLLVYCISLAFGIVTDIYQIFSAKNKGEKGK